MNKLALAAALSVAATTSFAGGLDEPIIEAPIIVEETGSSAGGILVPILLLILIGAAVSAS